MVYVIGGSEQAQFLSRKGDEENAPVPLGYLRKVPG
jgi:hypothetical protein